MFVANNISPVNVENRKGLDIRSGDTVRVWTKVEEKGKTRLQAFEGIVLARKHGSEPGATFTVRKIASGVGVERIFPLYSPNVDKIELVKRPKTRRSKLYYIRKKAAKEIRRKMKSLGVNLPDFSEKETSEPTEPATEEAQIGKEDTAENVSAAEGIKEEETTDNVDSDVENTDSNTDTETETEAETK